MSLLTLLRRVAITCVFPLACGGALAVDALCASAALPLARARNIRQPTLISPRRNAQFVAATEKSGLVAGSRVRTQKNGQVLIQFTNGTKIILRGNSQLEIVSAPSLTQPLILRLFGAYSQAWVKPQGNTRFVTSAGIAAAPGTEFLLYLPREDKTELTVTEGEVVFSNKFGTVNVLANQFSSAQVGSAPTPPVAVDTSGLTQWTANVTGLPVEFEQPLPPELITLPAGRRIIALLKAREYTAARNTLANAQDFTSLLARSIAERGDGDAPAAQLTAQKALDLAVNGDQRTQARVTLALAHLADTYTPEAQALSAARAALGEGQDPTSLILRALASLRAGDTGATKQDLQAALLTAPNAYQAHALLCLTLLQDGKSDADILEAIREGRQSVKLAPQSALAHSALGLSLFFLPDPTGQYKTLKEAKQEAQTAVKLNPDSPFALLVQGRTLLAQQNLDAARNSYQLARAYAPALPLLDTELGQIYLRLDQNPRAEKAFRRVLEKHPDDVDARAGLGIALARQGKNKESETEFLQALALDPANPQARGGYALLLIEQGKFKEAEARLRGGLGTGPSAGVQYVLLSEALLFQQKLVESGRYALLAVKVLPASALSHYQLGRVYFEQERFTQAEEQFRQAATYDPLFAEALYALGQSLEQTERGNDPTRPLGSAIGVNQSGPTRTLSLLNLQAPGAEELLQAALSDPTVVRTASRSFGDTQLDTRLGSNSSHSYDVSYSHESSDKRGVMGGRYQSNSTNGVRVDNADSENNLYGLFIGHKAQGNSAGMFGQFQYEAVHRGSNFLEEITPGNATAREQRRNPSGFLGFTWGENANKRTRILLGAARPTTHSANDDLSNLISVDTRFHSYQFEIRHDRQLNEQNRLSIGGSLGQRQQNGLVNTSFDDGTDFLTANSGFNTKANQFQLYARDEFQVSSHLRLTGELKVERLALNYNTQSSNSLFPLVTRKQSEQTNTTASPLLITEYRPDPRSSFRLRVRRALLHVQDFELLAPRDVFVESFDPSTIGDIGGKGWGYDLEYDHSFGVGNFLRASLFRQRFTDPFDALSGGEKAVSFQGAQLRYEGTLSSTTTFFTGLSYTSATSQTEGDNGLVSTRYQFVPRYTAEVGLQYLSSRGWFLQPSFAYLGSRVRSDVNTDEGTLPTRIGGTGILNIRVGRRMGLRFSGFLEVINATNRNYIVRDSLQSGRQIRVGITTRFGSS